ncbi:MFS transporter [Thalassorhabdomicrobium marinisediminis]|uniref:MFS transporter n=1 Tax=Thalassorhabdomicrobium marinisediminis TaxID=2170577 RepID=A0A2T7G1H1_9RHOB|nr:MFS transporter [Thalassorhabdomicrobium marinisediminis]PVA08283.1 MFS transporter [Thalassorhabdomicrobium marinisediminis]
MQDTSPHAPTPWPLILLLWSTGLLAAAQFAKLTLTIGPMQTLYDGAPVALAVSGVSIIGIIGGAVAGYLVARIGARKAVLWAVATSAVLALGQGVAMPFWAFMTTRILEGFGHLLLVVALPTMMVALAAPNDKSVVMGLWGTFFGVGYAVLAVVVPPVEAWGGIRAVYVGHGLLLAALFPVLWWVLPRVMAGASKIPDMISLHRTLYSHPRYFAPGLGHGIYTTLFIALVAFLPPVLDAMWLTAMMPLANLSGTFASGFIARRVAASHLSIFGFAVAAVCFALLAVTGSAALALLAMVATGITAGANFAAVPELNARPQDQARANGAMAQVGNLGTFSGTPLFALVAGSLWGLVGLSVAICLSGVIFAGYTYHRARVSTPLG